MIKTILIAVVLLVLAIMAMAFKVLAVKGGRFPTGHVCRHDFQQKDKEKNKNK